MSSQGGGGYSELFFTCVGSGYFFGFKILNFNILWGFQKNKNSFGYAYFVDIFFFGGGGSPQNWPIFRGHFYAF